MKKHSNPVPLEIQAEIDALAGLSEAEINMINSRVIRSTVGADLC